MTEIHNTGSAKKMYTHFNERKLYVVYLSQYLTNLMHKICFTISFISCLYMFRAHMLIIRRSSWLNTEINILRCMVNKTSKSMLYVSTNFNYTSQVEYTLQ